MRYYESESDWGKKVPEDRTRCVQSVMNWSGWHMIQCSRKRGYGPNGEYCKQHAKMLERNR